MRVTVVGGGIMGLSAAWACARDGAHVTLVEQATIPHALGSSVDDHRLIRYPYGATHAYARLVAAAYPAWDRLWADLGRTLYAETGTLVLGGPSQDWAVASADSLAKLGQPYQWLEPAELQRRYPLLDAKDLDGALYTPTGGTLFAGAIVTALADYLRPRIDLREKTRVRAIDGVTGTVETDSGERIEGDHVVVAAGPWTCALLPDYAARVRPTRQTLVYLAPPPGTVQQWAAMPMVLDIDTARGFYLVPPTGGRGLKVGDHSFGTTFDPDASRDPTADEIAEILDLARPRLANFDQYGAARAAICCYTVEPKERLLVETTGRLTVMSPCSGHGFKFGTVLGEGVADILAGRRSAADVAAWAAGAA